MTFIKGFEFYVVNKRVTFSVLRQSSRSIIFLVHIIIRCSKVLAFLKKISVKILKYLLLCLMQYAGQCGYPGCGKYGRCSINDTCTCAIGYHGYLCNKTCK